MTTDRTENVNNYYVFTVIIAIRENNRRPDTDLLP